MSAHSCKVFADTLLANVEAQRTFDDSVGGGLTVFCLVDDVFKAFLPKYKNLTQIEKAALLEYHGVPVYQSLALLKFNTGDMNILATTDGANNYDLTKVMTAKITDMLIDQDPVSMLAINKVLLPRELYAPVPTPAPAPAPKVEADAPEAPKKKGNRKKSSHA